MSGATALAGLLTCLGVLFAVWWRQGQQRVHRIASRVEGRRSTDSEKDESHALSRGKKRRGSGVGDQELAALCVEVAARLRAGASVDTAWGGAWARLTGEERTEMGKSGVPLAVERSEAPNAQVVVAATRFSSATGAPLAEILEQCGDSLGDLEQAQSAQRLAFAGPTMSARVLATLPLLGFVGGELLGAGSFAWFLSGPAEAAFGAVGFALGAAGYLVSKRMIAKASAVSQEQQLAPTLCDLVNAGIRGGASVPSVLHSLGEALGNSDYARVSAELTLGAGWKEAWEPNPFGSALLYGALQPAWEEGVAPGALLAQAATYARRRSLSDAKEAAEKLGVKLALPLGLLLLPSFIAVGLIPIFFTLVGTQNLPF